MPESAPARIPDYGRFRLYPGMAPNGTIVGRRLRLLLAYDGTASLSVDGVKVEISRSGESNLVGANRYGSDGWRIDGPVCSRDLQNCGKAINVIGPNEDRSVTFWVLVLVGPDTYTGSTPVP